VITTFKRPRAGRASAAWLLLAASIALAPMATAKQRIEQLGEDNAQTRRISASKATLPLAAPLTQVCEPGAKWIRLGFNELQLKSYDTLTLVSSGGDRYTFEGPHWNNRAFHARAMRGSCVDIKPYFGNPDSRYKVDSFQFGMQALETTTVTVAGAGDICDTSGTACSRTSDLIVGINPTSVFTAGDNAYSNGTLTEYNTRYDPTWGRFKTLTSPTPGNHDYNTSSASGYFDYFNGVGNQTGPAGDRSRGYYSYDVGDWHFIALNTMSGGTVSTTQLTWLEQDLAANTKPCTAAYFHHPLVSRGNYSGYSQVKPFYQRLYAAKADLVLVGHDHNYQRYAKMDENQAARTDGLRQVLVGTGGRSFYSLSGTHALLEASNANTHGVLKLTLTATGYTGDFMKAASSGSFTDTFSGTCNKTGSSGSTLTLSATRDVTVKSDGTRDNGTTLLADGDDVGKQYRGLMGWDLTGAAGLDITAALVRLNVTNLSTGTYDLYQVTSAWTEADATFAGTTLGSKIGSVVPSTTGTHNIQLNATGLQLVKDWAAGTASNHGVILANASGVVDGVDWTSREGAVAPQLLITHSGTTTNTPPVANFSFTTSNLTATFTDSSTDSDGTVASRSWNFGDGTAVSTATNPSHAYAAAGTYSVALTVTDNGGATHTVTKTVTVTTSTVLTNGTPVTGISGAIGSSQFWTMAVPAGASNLKFVTSGGTGDADLYVKFGSAPTTASYDCKSEGGTNAETCNIATAQTGTYHVLVKGYSAFSGLSLTGSYSTGGSSQTYSNTTDYTISDNATVDSPITVSGRSGNAPSNASISVNILHSYKGDLKVDLVAPDGTLYNIHNRTGTSTDNVIGTFMKDLSSEPLNGTWKLRVNDNASGDVGKIDSWSITF